MMEPKNVYDFCLKLLLVGDSDVGKQELMETLPNDPALVRNDTNESDVMAYLNPTDVFCKTTTLRLDGNFVKLSLWDSSGQGRFATIYNSYSRGAHGILLVYDITNRWSFDGIARWMREIDEIACGVPKVLIGNRLHREFERQVTEVEAENFAIKHGMTFFEPFLTLPRLSRAALLVVKDQEWRKGLAIDSPECRYVVSCSVLTLMELCTEAVVSLTTIYSINLLPVPAHVKRVLRSFARANRSHCRAVMTQAHSVRMNLKNNSASSTNSGNDMASSASTSQSVSSIATWLRTPSTAANEICCAAFVPHFSGLSQRSNLSSYNITASAPDHIAPSTSEPSCALDCDVDQSSGEAQSESSQPISSHNKPTCAESQAPAPVLICSGPHRSLSACASPTKMNIDSQHAILLCEISDKASLNGGHKYNTLELGSFGSSRTGFDSLRSRFSSSGRFHKRACRLTSADEKQKKIDEQQRSQQLPHSNHERLRPRVSCSVM